VTNSCNGREGSVSLARFVLDTVARLRDATGQAAQDPLLANLVIKEISVSVAYDPGQEGAPLPLPWRPGGVPILPLPEARRTLIQGDREVRLDRVQLLEAPSARIARLEVRIRLPTP
jgi:hypothetical protein